MALLSLSLVKSRSVPEIDSLISFQNSLKGILSFFFRNMIIKIQDKDN